MGTHNKTEEIQVVRPNPPQSVTADFVKTEVIEAVVVSESAPEILSDTPIYDGLVKHYVTYYGWIESDPYALEWIPVTQPLSSFSGASSGETGRTSSSDAEFGEDDSNGTDAEEGSDSSDDGTDRTRIDLLAADRLAESFMPELPTASVSSRSSSSSSGKHSSRHGGQYGRERLDPASKYDQPEYRDEYGTNY